MTTQEVKRKLAAILSADVKGYSRLMGEDEEGTIRTLTTYKEAMSNLIQQQRGRVVDAPGDNVLAEFGSVVDAVRCAVDIQKEFKNRNAQLPEKKRMEFRIGVNLGDVVEEEGKIFGDGVNIAARMESLSEAGGVCISGSAYDFVGKKLSLGYEYLGEHTVKNIEKAVRVYRVLMEPEAAGKVIGEKKAKPRQWQMATMGLVIGVIVVVAAIVIWKVYTPSAPQPEVISKEKITASLPEKPSSTVPPSAEVVPKEKGIPPLPEKVSKPVAPPAPKVEFASKEKMAFPLPDKPSIAVLPFVNMSEDKSQEYFSDGLTEEIITALSKVPRLFVIARNSTFTYKGKPVKVKQISEELGVQYVLEGSVRRSGDQIRITAQLIDATTGNHLWAERYDREMKDIFAIQDELTMKIVTSFIQLTESQSFQLRGKYPSNLQAYLKLLEGMGHFYANKFGDAMKSFEEALRLDPNFPPTYFWMAWVHMMNVLYGPSATHGQSLEKAFQFAEKAKALDDKYWGGPSALGTAYLLKRDYDKALFEGKLSTELAPNSSGAATFYGWTLRSVGRYEEALKECERALRIDPLNFYPMLHMGSTYLMMRRFDESIAVCKKAVERNPRSVATHIVLAVAYSSIGKMEEAHEAASQVLKLNPNFSLEDFAKAQPNKYEEDRGFGIDALRKAGLK